MGHYVETEQGGDEPAVAARYALYALLIIFLANFLSYLDRQIVSALEKELRGAFGFSKAEFGATWTAFTIGYMVFAPVVGFLTGRFRRSHIFAVCVFLWSFATIWSGIAGTKLEFYAARFCIGIGEAGCLVIGPPLIADYFIRAQRGRALSVFFLGMPLGGTAGYIVAALVAKYVHWPHADDGSWRNAFYFAGLPGIGLAVFVWMLHDPRAGSATGGSSPESRTTFSSYLELFRNRTLMMIILAQAFAVIILVPLLHFGVHFLEVKHAMDKDEASLSLGGIALVAGGLGNFVSGILGDRLGKRMHGGYALLAAVGYTAGLPFLIVGFIATSKIVMLLSLTAGAFCYFLCMPAVNTQIANCVRALQRPMAFALAVFILHLLGDTFAPILFGSVSDRLAQQLGSEELGTQHTFVGFSMVMLAAGLCCFVAMNTAKRDEEAAHSA